MTTPANITHKRLEGCESLRGLAIVLVFAYHFLGSLVGYAPRPDAGFSSALLFGGAVGVDLFFVLSGFLLSLPYWQGNSLNVPRYAANRALRILPMYYVMIVAGVLWTGDWRHGLQAAVFQNIGLLGLAAFSLVWWSLVVEAQFYVALPVTVWLARTRAGRAFLCVCLAAASYAYIRIAAPHPSAFWASQRDTLLGRWPQFGVGCLAAWAHDRFGDTLQRMSISRRRWAGTAVALVSLLALNALTWVGLRRFGAAQASLWFVHALYASILWAIFMVAVIDLWPVGRRLVINPVLHRLGIWSYSIYLTHAVFMVFVFLRLGIAASPAQLRHPGRNVLMLVGLSTVTLAVSALTYRWIERPFLALKHHRFLSIGRVREDAM
jgi:peptidoglycan/LPS O-acetylase OafA/YrhL